MQPIIWIVILEVVVHCFMWLIVVEAGIRRIWSILLLKLFGLSYESCLIQFFCVIYRSPSSDTSVLGYVADMLELAQKENKNVILMGEFNVNMLGIGSLLSTLLLIVEEYCLTQLISEPTRLTPTSQTLIDVIFVTCPGLFTGSGTFPFLTVITS